MNSYYFHGVYLKHGERFRVTIEATADVESSGKNLHARTDDGTLMILRPDTNVKSIEKIEPAYVTGELYMSAKSYVYRRTEHGWQLATHGSDSYVYDHDLPARPLTHLKPA